MSAYNCSDFAQLTTVHLLFDVFNSIAYARLASSYLQWSSISAFTVAAAATAVKLMLGKSLNSQS